MCLDGCTQVQQGTPVKVREQLSEVHSLLLPKEWFSFIDDYLYVLNPFVLSRSSAKPGLMAHTCNPSPWKTEPGELLHVQRPSRLARLKTTISNFCYSNMKIGLSVYWNYWASWLVLFISFIKIWKFSGNISSNISSPFSSPLFLPCTFYSIC